MKTFNFKVIQTCFFILVILLADNGCSSPNTFYIDIKKQAIVSCKGEGFKKITISNKFSEINLEGTPPIIYFNVSNNVSRTLIYDSVVQNFKLFLQPKTNYEVKAHMGPDRALFTLTFRTDSLCKVSSASRLNCN